MIADSCAFAQFITTHIYIYTLSVSLSLYAQITKAIQQAKTDEEVQELLVRYSSHFYSTLAAEIGRLEGEIRKNYPEFKFLGLEII